MSRIEDLKEEIKDEKDLEALSRAFTEVSSLKIGGLKREFEKNKSFYREVSELYQLIKISAERAGITATTGKSPRGTLEVAVTTNNRFYGVINLEVIRKFVESARGRAVERLVIGKTGIKYLKSIDYREPYEELIFSRDVPRGEEIRNLLRQTADYQKVFLYFPRFVTMFSQVPAVADITYSPDPRRRQQISGEEIRFIFEPELKKIFAFFETQIRYILVGRVMLEVELAITASRLRAMSRSQERAAEVLKEKQRRLQKESRSLINARLLEAITATRAGTRG